MGNQLEKRENTAIQAPESTVDRLLMSAVENNVPVEQLEKLLDMQQRLKDEQARRAYFDAMAEFQAVCPEVPRTKKGGQGRYAPLETIVATVRPSLTRHGLSYSFDTRHDESHVLVYCTIRHRDGHQETSEARIPRYQGRGTNSAQDEGGAITYGRRYALCNALGIVTADPDTDAQTPRAPEDALTKSHIATLKRLAKKAGMDEPTLLRGLSAVCGYQLEAVSEFPERLFQQAKSRLEARVSRETPETAAAPEPPAEGSVEAQSTADWLDDAGEVQS